MRVAYFSPLPPERSGIADYSALLLPALERRLDVRVARRGTRRLPRGTDVALYHVGNNPEVHGWIVEALRRNRGLVVLHDFVLHHLVAGLTYGSGDPDAYLEAMEVDGGVIGRLLAHGVIDGLIPPLWEIRPHDYPLVDYVISAAGGLIVHSEYAEGKAREAGFRRPIWRIPMPAWPEANVEPDADVMARGSLRIGFVGNIVPSKRIGQLLAAFVRLQNEHPDAVLVLAGAARGVDLDSRLAALDLVPGKDVFVLGHLDEDRLWSVMASCDVCVSLRRPTMGETSGTVIRALGLGRPLVVSDVGWFAELPDEVAAKIPVDESEIPVLTAVLERLAQDDELRKRMGAAARAYVRREHDLERVADLYAAACLEYVGGLGVETEVLGDVSRAALDVGIDASDPATGDLAQRIRELKIVR
jgi:glycosyltransferase involved in cell wall biosynthesis